MAALRVGAKAPEFELKTLDDGKFALSQELGSGPVVLAFFKVSCPTCQYALPFLERLYVAYAKNGVTLVGISQNETLKNANTTGPLPSSWLRANFPPSKVFNSNSGAFAPTLNAAIRTLLQVET